MAVVFHIPGFLRTHTSGRSQVKIDGSPATAGDALRSLCAMHPGVRDRVLDDRGAVREHVNLFVGAESIRFTGGLDTAVPDGSEITIVPAISGGRDPA